MAIDLNNIPGKLTIPKPPAASRWLLIIVLITVLGVILALYLWPEGKSTYTTWFWFYILAIPLSAGLICYALRLRAYENERDRVNYWNRLHQEQHDIHVENGRRSAGVLGKAYITPIACNKLASALSGYGSQLQSTYFAHLQRTLTTARLDPSVTHVSQESYRARLAGYLARLLRMLEPDFCALPDDKLSVRLRHDGSLDDAQIAQVWRDIFPASSTFDVLTSDTEEDGMMWLDPWLDHHQAMVMLSVEINLFMEPRDYQAESVSALLLASPEWLAQYEVVPEVVIHRPVVLTEDESGIQNMLCWGKLSADELHTLWRGPVDKDALTRLIQQSERLGYSPGQEEEYILDDLFGNPGAAAGNIALLCACEYAITSGKPQWIIMTDRTTHQAIVRQEKC